MKNGNNDGGLDVIQEDRDKEDQLNETWNNDESFEINDENEENKN